MLTSTPPGAGEVRVFRGTGGMGEAYDEGEERDVSDSDGSFGWL